MKICPVCDQKMEGRWCKRCHRFVTPWIIKEDIYINERHPSHDDSCEYHNPHYMDMDSYKMQLETKTNAPGTTPNKQQVTAKTNVKTSGNAYNTQKSSYTPSSGATRYQGNANLSSKNTQKNRKNSKAGLVIALIYMGIVILGVLGSLFEDLFDNAVDNFFNSDYEYTPDIQDTDDYYGTDDDSWKKIEFYEDTNQAHLFLKVLNPAYAEVDDYGWGYQYYNPSDIKLMGQECDASHFDYDMSKVKTMAYDLYGSSKVEFEVYEDASLNYREYYLGNEYSYDYEPTTNFETYHYANVDDMSLYVSADTYSNNVHYIEFYVNQKTDESLKLIYYWFDNYYEGIFASFKDFKAYLEEVEKSGDYKYIDTDTSLGYVAFSCVGSSVDITIYPY